MDLKKEIDIFDLENIDEYDLEMIKKIYRILAKEKHPDKNGGDNKKFIELRSAYHILQRLVAKNQSKSNARKLRALTKDEILEAYFRETEELQLKINELETRIEDILGKTKENIKDIVSDFEKERETLQAELDLKIKTIQNKITKNTIKKILFFLPSYSEEKFWQEYNQEVQKSSTDHTRLDLKFFKRVLDVYGNSLNEISRTVESQNIIKPNV